MDEFVNLPLIPEEYYCPLTKKIMLDPVVASDGYTYEKEAIENWSKNHTTYPNSEEKISSLTILPNRSLERNIKKFLEQNPLLWETDKIYLSNTLIHKLISAISNSSIQDIENILSQDKRLLKIPLENQELNSSVVIKSMEKRLQEQENILENQSKQLEKYQKLFTLLGNNSHFFKSVITHLPAFSFKKPLFLQNMIVIDFLHPKYLTLQQNNCVNLFDIESETFINNMTIYPIIPAPASSQRPNNYNAIHQNQNIQSQKTDQIRTMKSNLTDKFLVHVMTESRYHNSGITGKVSNAATTSVTQATEYLSRHKICVWQINQQKKFITFDFNTKEHSTLNNFCLINNKIFFICDQNLGNGLPNTLHVYDTIKHTCENIPEVSEPIIEITPINDHQLAIICPENDSTNFHGLHSIKNYPFSSTQLKIFDCESKACSQFSIEGSLEKIKILNTYQLLGKTKAGVVMLFDIHHHTTYKLPLFVTGPIFELSPQGHLVVSYPDNTIRVWDIEKNECIQILQNNLDFSTYTHGWWIDNKFMIILNDTKYHTNTNNLFEIQISTEQKELKEKLSAEVPECKLQ